MEIPEHWNGTLVLYSHGYVAPHYQQVLDLVTFQQQAMAPAFVHHRPPRPLRPSR